MIVKEKSIKILEIDNNNVMDLALNEDILSRALYFDLEHYVYKVPICVGVFGCAVFHNEKEELLVTQYMIENGDEVVPILEKAILYFKAAEEKGIKYIVTFSGNNDFVVINYLFKKFDLDYNVCEHFISLDIQKEYEKITKKGIGLKALEKEFEIERECDLISGSNLAKTFAKVVKDEDYFQRMPSQKKDKILNYNEDDVANLFYILCQWNKYMKEYLEEKEEEKELQ